MVRVYVEGCISVDRRHEMVRNLNDPIERAKKDIVISKRHVAEAGSDETNFIHDLENQIKAFKQVKNFIGNFPQCR